MRIEETCGFAGNGTSPSIFMLWQASRALNHADNQAAA